MSLVSDTQCIWAVCVIDLYHVIQHDESHDSQQGGLLELPSVTLHHVISYLTDPHDLLNFGLAHPLVLFVLWMVCIV